MGAGEEDGGSRERARSALSEWPRDRLVREVQRLRRQLAARARGGTRQDGDGPLRTVRVPEAMTEAFEAAEARVDEFFDALVHDPARATISIGGERYVLVRAASLSVEFVELVTSLYRERGPTESRTVAENLLFDFAHAIGRADAAAFHDRADVTDPIARLSTGPVHFAFAGWASVAVDPSSRPTPDEDFFLLYDHPYSFESHAWRTKGRESDRPVCIMNAGYSSGWCQESFGLSLVALEVECCAAGAERCRFVMAPPARMQEHLARLGYEQAAEAVAPEEGASPVAVPEFFKRRRWEEELRAVNQRLEERVIERTQALEAASEELKVLATAVENAREGVVMLETTGDAELTIRSANQGFGRVTGVSPRAARGRSLAVVGPVNEEAWADTLARSLAEREPFEIEVPARRPDGEQYMLELDAMPVDADDPGSPHWIGLLRDVTRRRRHLAELRRQATTDALTDLPNRALLYERLEDQVAQAVATDQPLGLLVIDLDGFKNINDAFGHPVGDTLLEQVGPRLQRHLRAEDTVARLGGDEFAVLLPGIRSRRNALKQAELMLATLQEPFLVAAQEVVLGASIGVALCPEHGLDGATLLRRGDVAMYAAKESGRGPVVYRSALDRNAPERLALVGELRTGIEQDQLVVHYQPQLDARTLQARRVEALVRWQHPVHGLLPPDQFLPYIELGNLVERLTDAVMAQAVRDCVAWRRQGLAIDMAVNVPPRLLRDLGFVDSVARCLARHGLPASALTLEVTESGLLADVEQTLPVFEALCRVGVRLSIDDFGTGYSSFTHLRRLPVDEIKIDRSFVRQMVDDRQDAAIVRSTIELAASIGRNVVAEGVEDGRTLSLLRGLGCEYVQGFCLARPMSADDLVAWTRRRLTASALRWESG